MSSASELSPPIPSVAPLTKAIRPLSLRENFAWTLPANLVYAACQWGILVVLAQVGSTGLVGLYVLGLSISQHLPIAYLADGPRIPEDLHLPRSHQLVSRAVSLQSEDNPSEETMADMFSGLYNGASRRVG